MMATHKATICAWIEVEFDDDGISELADQASDAFNMKDFAPHDCDYQVMEVTEINPPAAISKATSRQPEGDRKSTSELQSLMRISYAVRCLKTQKTRINTTTT